MAGGARRGAGRKFGSKTKKTIETKLLRDRLKEKVAEKWDPLIDSQIDKAIGIVIMKTEKGFPVFKDQGPDPNAFRTLIEQAIGKPIATFEEIGDLKTKELEIISKFLIQFANEKYDIPTRNLQDKTDS